MSERRTVATSRRDFLRLAAATGGAVGLARRG